MTSSRETPDATPRVGLWSLAFSPTRMAHIALLLAVIGLLVATVLAGLARFHWIAELATHFKVQYAMTGIVVLILLLATSRWRTAAMCAVLSIWHLIGIVPFYVPSSNVIDETESVRVLLANVLGTNRETDEIIAHIRETEPDLVLVQELRPHWAEALKVLHDDYPYRRVIPRPDFFGIAQYSKFPFEEITPPEDAGYGLPMIVSRVDVEGRSFVLANIHTTPPVSRDLSLHRVRMLNRLRERLDNLDEPIVVAGDLNMSPWSPYYSDFVRDLSLSNSRRGFGLLPTWPLRVRQRLFLIPIDHILVGPEIGVVDRQRGPEIGSDHYPIWADLGIPKNS